MGALMRSIDWSKTPLGPVERLVAGAADDGRSAAAQPVPDAALVGARVRPALQRRLPADPGRQAPEVDGPAGRGMLGGDLAHHRADDRGAVPRRAGDLERRPRPADRPQGVPRGDALQGRLQPGPRRDRAADRHRRRARDRGRDDGGRVRRAPAAHAARAGRARGRAPRRPSRRARRRRRRWATTRATCRSPSSICSTTPASTAHLAGSVRPGRERRRRAADGRARRAVEVAARAASPSSAASSSCAGLREQFAALPCGAWSRAAAHRDRPAAGVARSAARLRRAGRRAQPAPRARRRLPRLLRAGRRAGRDRDPQRAAPTRRSGGAPRRWPRSIAPRRRSSPTSATSSARR